MSTTRPHQAGDCGPEPEGPATAAATSADAAAGAGARGIGRTAGEAPVSRSGEPGGADTRGQGEADTGDEQDADPVSASDSEGGSGAMGTAAESAESVTARKGRPMRQVRRLRLVGASGAVPRARDFTRQALHDWGWLPAATADQRAAAEDVLLVVSELVTNACLHANGPEELRIGAGPKVLRLEIVDLGSGSPSPRTPHRAGRPGGHGMFIVQRLCLDWGVVRNAEGPGKTVWAELAAPN